MWRKTKRIGVYHPLWLQGFPFDTTTGKKTTMISYTKLMYVTVQPYEAQVG